MCVFEFYRFEHLEEGNTNGTNHLRAGLNLKGKLCLNFHSICEHTPENEFWANNWVIEFATLAPSIFSMRGIVSHSTLNFDNEAEQKIENGGYM